MQASHGCSPLFILAGFISSARISDPLVHVLSSLLWFSFLLSLCVSWLPCLVECTLQLCVCVSVCLHGKWAVHKVVIPPLFSTVSHNNCAYRAHRQTPRFHPLCCGNSLYNFLSGVRKGMAVSTITAVKAGLLGFFLFFFWTGDSQVRKVMQHLQRCILTDFLVISPPHEAQVLRESIPEGLV